MTAQPNLFDDPPPQRRAQVTPEESETTRGGRHDAAGQTPAIPRPQRPGDMAPPIAAAPRHADPRIHLCHCGVFGSYGDGRSWFCRSHMPADFLPHMRGEGRR